MSLQLISVVSALETMKLRVSNGLNKHKSKVFGAHGVDLVEYLGNVHNYNRFALYLSNCYALENLRFLEAIIIFHNALRTCLGRKKTRRKYPQLSLNRLFSLKFKYLSKLNKEYIRKIEGGNIDDISRHIYNKFISLSSDQSINISWDVRRDITEFFDDTNVSKSETELKHIYLDLFNAAVLEIYRLLDSRYCDHFVFEYNQNVYA
eukprot:140130_1